MNHFLRISAESENSASRETIVLAHRIVTVEISPIHTSSPGLCDRLCPPHHHRRKLEKYTFFTVLPLQSPMIPSLGLRVWYPKLESPILYRGFFTVLPLQSPMIHPPPSFTPSSLLLPPSIPGVPRTHGPRRRHPPRKNGHFPAPKSCSVITCRPGCSRGNPWSLWQNEMRRGQRWTERIVLPFFQGPLPKAPKSFQELPRG